jgi:hypothetical protein
MFSRRTTKWIQRLVGILAAMASFQASAASVSYFLDQSNVSALPDGNDYLKVTISDSTTVSGNIDFKVETLAPLNGIAGTSGFGVDQFGFNTNNALTSGNFVLPANWTYAGSGQMDGFGLFNLQADTNGAGNRLATLNFSVTGVTGDTVYDYVMLSSGNAGQGNTFFAAHVAGFDAGGGVTSAYFAGSAPVPLPAAAWLFGSGLLGLLGVARRRQK